MPECAIQMLWGRGHRNSMNCVDFTNDTSCNSKLTGKMCPYL